MAQFVVYENTNRSTKKVYPYLLDIQCDLLDELRTTVVIPLALKSKTGAATISRLCPVLKIDNLDYIAVTQQIAGIDRKILGNQICDLSGYRTEMIAALDFIFSGI